MVKVGSGTTKMETKKIFFAYQGRRNNQSDDNVDSIVRAIADFNSRQSQYLAESWEDYKKTSVINTEILSAIDKSEVFVADVTYFNHNVLFELGYAIGKNKRILIFLNKRIAGADDRYRNSILKNIKNQELINFKSITSALSAHLFKNGLLDELVNTSNIDINTAEIFHIQCRVPGEASIQLTDGIAILKDLYSCHVVNADPAETPYRPLNWYFTSIFISRLVVIHMLGKNYEEAHNENAKNSFYAGLALGLGKEVLLVAPYSYPAPLDYDDIMFQYGTAKECTDRVVDWLEKRLTAPQLVKEDSLSSAVEGPSKYVERQTNLIKLGIGEVVAEDEQVALGAYFVETASYHVAQTHSKSIVLGRKGSGKSAIYYRLLSDFSLDKHNYVLSLRPESEELLHDVEISSLYNTPASKKTFFLSVWKLVLLSKMIKCIHERLSEKNTSTYTTSEQQLIAFYRKNESMIHLNFFGVMKEISIKLNGDEKLDSPKVLTQLYAEFLTPMINILKEYFNSIAAKYIKITILADNMDKTWDAKNDLDIQSEMILSLLEMENVIRNLLLDKRGNPIEVKEIVFLRKDIFDYIKVKYLEPDKLEPMMHEIDWNLYPVKLKELVDTRIQQILGLKDISAVEEIWTQYFSLSDKRHPYDVVEINVTRRPRDIIFIINALFASAVNRNHIKILDSDLANAVKSYRKFLTANLVAETSARYPGLNHALVALVDSDVRGMEYREFEKILQLSQLNVSQADSLIEDLFLMGHLRVKSDSGEFASTASEVRKSISKKSTFFYKNKTQLFFTCRAVS